MKLKSWGTQISEYKVEEFDQGKTLSEFIDEMNAYFGGAHDMSHIYVFNKTRNKFWHQVAINIPWGKELDKSKLPQELLDLPVCCDHCYARFESYHFYVYSYEDFKTKGEF